MAWGAAIAAGASIIGGMMANKGAKSSIANQLAFQKESAQNSYQWATADMKKAGINPMLAYQRGGASALSGANYKPENVLGAASNSALQVMRQSADIKNIESNTRKTNFEGTIAERDAFLKGLQVDLMKKAENEYHNLFGSNSAKSNIYKKV